MNLSDSNALLAGYISEKNDGVALGVLEQLVEKVSPLIEKIVVANLRNLLSYPFTAAQSQDIPDVCQEIITRLLTYFRRLRASEESNSIQDLNAYVATVTYNCCYEYKQRKYPQRFRLKKKLQYLLSHHISLGIWRDESQEWFGGLREWGGDLGHWQIQTTQRTQQLVSPQLPSGVQPIPDATLKRNSAADQLVSLFEWSQEFIHLGDLTTIFQQWWNLSDETVQLEDRLLNQPFASLNIENALVTGRKLKAVWVEIGLLPLPQRKALLLNLRDSVDRELVTLFPVLEIASLQEIAKTLEMPSEKLAQVWRSLPLNDQQIADEMGLERRQVINLRRTARERLVRRLSPNW